ncbi:MAG: hypothetical protein JRG80_05555 [Deltaproteobacteria bacterium]|nr:hypothetical protein [Deltaproteobacteria bacterium]
MAEALTAKDQSSADNASDRTSDRGFDRLASFRIIYIAIFSFVAFSVVTVLAVESLLSRHFKEATNAAIRVSPANGPIAPQIQSQVSDITRGSAWTRLGGVSVRAIVIGANGSIIYSGGQIVPPPPSFDPIAVFREAQRLLPASVETFVAVPINSLLVISILVSYGAILISGLFVQNRNVARREAMLIQSAIDARDETAKRTGNIERELEQVRMRLLQVEPAERAHTEEIQELQQERGSLQRKLLELAEREQKLRSTAERSIELDEERRALEDLLEEAATELGEREETIGTLKSQLKRAAKTAPSGRSRATEQLAKRMRTLYKSLEFDDRAISDMIALRDETNRLKSEEAIKRLSDDADNTAIRRKVGGLPPQLSIFELGFAGKGRVYYTRGGQQRFRILAIGAKNTQKTDLEYLSRLST